MAVKLTEEQLNNLDKSIIVTLFLGLQDQVEALTQEVHSLNDQMQLLMEQVILGRQERFGRSSEKMDDTSQIAFMEVDGDIVFFNEAEAVNDLPAEGPEDPDSDKKKRGSKRSGKKEADIAGLPVKREDFYLKDEELTAEFGANGWKQLPDTVIRKYQFIPAQVYIKEDHVGVYASKSDDRIIRAPHPKQLLHGSLVSASLGAAIMNGKYVNAVPLYRLEKEFERYGLDISRRNMANWMIRLSEEYLSILYDYLHDLLMKNHVVQADETPVLVNRDGRPANSKSYMWVYRSGYMDLQKQIILYDYQKTRNASHPRDFLRGFTGVCVTDGYQVYHSLEKVKDDFTVAGCWVHCRRRFDKAEKVVPPEARKKSIAYLTMKQIQAIYREEEKLKDLSADERLTQRQVVIKPLVDALFAYLKAHNKEVPGSGALRDAYTYALNQEKYLRVFLEDGEVPMDNNASERAIRGFTIGRKNWQVIDTVHGANASAVIYSIAETAKANGLKPYEYFEYLLTEIPKYVDQSDRSFLADLLPWSPNLPEKIRKAK